MVVGWVRLFPEPLTLGESTCLPSAAVLIQSILGTCFMQIAMNWLEIAGRSKTIAIRATVAFSIIATSIYLKLQISKPNILKLAINTNKPGPAQVGAISKAQK